MTADIYSLAIRVDSTQVNRANSDLDRLGDSTLNVTRSISQMNNAASSSASMLNQIRNSVSVTAQATSAMSQSMGRLESELSRVSNQARNAANSFGGLNSVLGAFGVATGVAGVAALTKNIVKLNMEMESLRARLDMTLPSLAASKNAFELIVKIAKETPQSIQEITKAFLLLRNSGLSTSEKDLRGWTDMAAKFGSQADDLTGVIRQFGQAMMKGKFQAQDTNAMIERGIPVYALLKEVTGKSSAEILKMAEAGEINNKIMEQMKEKLFEISSGSSAKAMDTLRGKIEALGSAWGAFADSLLQDKSEGIMKRIVDDWASALEGFADYLNKSTDRKIADKQARLAELEAGFKSDKLTYLKPNTTKSRLSEYEKEGIELTKLLNQKQDAIDDAAKMEKISRDQKQAEELKSNQDHLKAVANGESDALKKYMSAKLNAIKESDKAIIAQQAETASISAKLAMSIVAVESTGQAVVNKDSGAAGLMQVMPENYKKAGYTQSQMLNDSSISVKMGLKVWQDSMEEAQRAVVKGAIEANQTAEYAAALYTTKHQTVYDRIKKNKGVFDLNLFKEASDWWNKVSTGLEIQNQSASKTFAPYNKAASEAASETKKLANEAEQAAKKHQALVDRYKDKDPFEKYLADMAELKSIQGEMSKDTFLSVQKEIAETFLKSTVDLSKYNKELEKHKKQLEDVASYNATIDEINQSLKSGDISKTKASVLITQANANLMNQINKEKITAQAVPEYQQALRLDKEFEKSKEISKSYENEVEALQKIRREIVLNDDAAYEAHLRSKTFGDEKSKYTEQQISDLKKLREEVNMSKLWDDMGLSVRGLASSFGSMFSQVLTQGKSFTSALQGMLKNTVTKISDSLMNFGMNSLMSGNIFAGIAGIAGGIGSGLLSRLFGDKEKDLRLADTKLSSSNSIQNVVKTLNDIHAKEYKELQGINDNFTLLTHNIDNTIARAIAWNGSFVPSTVGMTANQAQGGVTKSALGGNSAAGIGVSGVTGAITGAAIYGASTAASALGVSLGGAGTAAIGAIGAMDGLAGGLVLGGAIYGLGKLLGIGKTKYTAIGNGLVTQPAKLIESGIEDGFKAYNFSVVKATTKTWFGNKSKIFEVINGVNDEMSQAFGSIFGQLGKTLSETFSTLGISSLTDYNLQSAVIPALKMTLTGKTDSEISDIITKMVNTMTDKMATEIVGGLFAPFVKSGESMLETVYRLATQVAVVKGAFHKVGVEVESTGMGAIALSDAISEIYESSIGAKDGLKQFTGAINDFYNAVLTQGEKVSMTIADYSAFVSANPQLGLSADASLVSGKQMMDAFTTASKAAQDAAKAAEPILNLGQAAQNAFDPKTTNELKEMLAGVWKNIVSAPYESMTSKDFSGDWWGIVQKRASTQGQENQNLYQEMVRVVLANEEKIAKGMSDIAGTGIESLEQYKQKSDEANTSIKKSAAELQNVTNQTGAFTVILNEFQKKFKDLDETILASVTTTAATTKRARDKQLSELKEYDKQRIASSALSLETKKLYAELTGTTIKANDAAGYLTSTLQEVAWQMEDTAKSTSKLVDANKYIMDFSRGIKQWVENLRATQLGSPSTQIESARRAFNEQLNLAKFAPDAETKRGALSGITGYADTFINAIKSFYGSSEEGQKQLQSVVDEVSNLEKGLSIQELQLGALQEIKDAIMDSTVSIPKGFESVFNKAQEAGFAYKANPTVDNALKFDALAKVALTITNAANGSDADLIQRLLRSTSTNAIQSAISVVINNAELSGGQKESILNNLTSEFNKALEGFDALEVVKNDIQEMQDRWNGLNLDPETIDTAGVSVKGLTNELVGLNGEYDTVIIKATGATQKVVDFGALDEKATVGIEGVDSVLIGLNSIKSAANDAFAALSQVGVTTATQGNSFLESQSVNAGYSGDYTDTNAMQSFLESATKAFTPVEMYDPTGKYYNATANTIEDYNYRKSTGWLDVNAPVTPTIPLAQPVASTTNNQGTEKTVQELQTVVRQQDAMIRVMQDGFSKLQVASNDQANNIGTLTTVVRLQSRG